jgi:hypothetical protein
VGLLEHSAESIQMLAHQTGRHADLKRANRRINENRDRPALSQLPADTIERIRAANQYDQQLYELAREIFQARWHSFCPACARP